MCPVCHSEAFLPIYRVDSVPVMSCELFATPEEARSIPTGSIDLQQCSRCGHVYNAAFDSAQVVYSPSYESTQSHSQTFDEFHRDLAASLNVAGKTIVEIGCGDGEFLTLLRENGAARAIGFDPASSSHHPDIFREYFPQPYPSETDLVICKMTLEHIFPATEFLRSIREINAPIFVTVPNAERIFADGALEDIYYEHCQYFTGKTLTIAAEIAGFEITKLDRIYENQYLALSAIPGKPEVDHSNYEGTSPVHLPTQDSWNTALEDLPTPIYLWGSGSKTVAFLSAVDSGQITGAIDINPKKHGYFLPGSGLPIIAPTDLPDTATVIAMNPIYRDEIAALLGPSHRLLTIREL